MQQAGKEKWSSIQNPNKPCSNIKVEQKNITQCNITNAKRHD